ncbi:hypothetical protein ACFWOD_30255 [Streptomyces sp. NPDC058434]
MLNNRDLNQVTWEMRALQGAPQFEESQHLPDVPYGTCPTYRTPRSRANSAWTAPGWRIRTRWSRSGARPAGDRPFVIDFRTDPAVPPIPPHATLDQIAAAAVVRGDPGSMLRQGFTAKIQDFLPGGKAGGRAGGQR